MDTPWWRDHRRRKYKQKSYLSIEMIVRKSIVDTAKNYLKHCSVNGVQYVCNSDLHIKQRLFWAAVILLAFVVVCHYSITYIFFNAITKPFTVTVQSSTYPIGNMNFPAVALCNVNRISKKALEIQVEWAYNDLKQDYNINKSEVREYFLNMGNLIYFLYDDLPSYQKYFDVLNSWLNKNKTNIVDLMKKLAPNCDEMLIQCSWAGDITDCKNFIRRRTIEGHCCTFNYIKNDNSADEATDPVAPIMRQMLPGPDFGLSVIIDPLLDDYAYTNGRRAGFNVFLFDPLNYAEAFSGQMIHTLTQANTHNIIHLESIKQIASPSIRVYSPELRRCRFQDESTTRKLYSYGSCLTTCRLLAIHSLCKCIPYFIPSSNYKDSRVCSLRDLGCLNKHSEKFFTLNPHDAASANGLEAESVDALHCPYCFPDCETTRYYSKSVPILIRKHINKNKEFRNVFLKGVNLTGKCLLSIYQTDATSTLQSFELVAQWYEILANFGGFAGMLMGLGVFTLAEITYFFIIRLIQIFYFNYRKYH